MKDDVGRTGAAKVNTANGPLWCHVSSKNDTVKCRRYVEGNVFEVEHWDDLENFVPLAECKAYVSEKQASYSFTNVQFWTEVIQRLQVKAPKITNRYSKKTGKPGGKVPITLLRRFYECIQEFNTARVVGLAEFYENNPKSLEMLWNVSRTTFSTYKNDAGWGQNRRKELPLAPNSLKDVSETNEFTAIVKKAMDGGDFLGFTFVEREINPRRTRNATFPDGTPATKSGRGGIDLLLATSEGVPVIGEVKRKKDRNVFYALLQAMTYAVELSTPDQLKRLKTHFGDSFQKLSITGGKVNIALFLVNPVKDATREPVKKLINKLNQNNDCEGLGKIELLWNEGEEWKRHF